SARHSVVTRAVEIGWRTIEEFPLHEIQGFVATNKERAMRVVWPRRRLEQYTFDAAWQTDDGRQGAVVLELRLEDGIAVGPDTNVDRLATGDVHVRPHAD